MNGRKLRWAALAGVLAPFLVGIFALLGLTAVQSGSESGGNNCTVTAPALGSATGAIQWPMIEGSYRITSGYGPRWGTLHAGLDMAAPIGTRINAAHDGVVERAEPASGFGLWVVVTGTVNGQKVSTVYGHINSYSVTAGQTVTAGQQIAEVGNRGESTGPHLHFEVWPGGRFGGATTDPTPWLNSRATAPIVASQPAPPPTTPTGSGEMDGPVPPQGRQSTMTVTAEQRANMETIVAVAKGAVTDDPATPVNEPLRLAVIAVATAIQESTLRVIDYGDLAGPDSRGLFQQRAPWGPYEARMDPAESTRMFLYGGRGGQRGLLSHNWRGMSLEDVVVATQISVGGYAKWEKQAMQLVGEATGVSPIAGADAVCAPGVVPSAA